MKASDLFGALALTTAAACMTRSSSRRHIADERWHLRENTSRGTYHMLVSGASNDAGSTVTIRADSTPTIAYGQAEYGSPLRSTGVQRVFVSSDIRPNRVRQQAVLWVSADRDGKPLVTEYAQIPVRGTSDWQRHETSLVVPENASAISYGVFLQGPGEVSIRHLTVEATQVPPPGTGLSASARAELDSAVHLARTYALWRDTVTWPVLEERVRRAAAGARDPHDVYPAIRLLVRALGDHHSSFYTAQDMTTFHSGMNIPAIEVRLVADGVGYVNSPGYTVEHRDSTLAYVRRSYEALRGAAPASRCGWVVDLRRNTGGTPEPMLAALAPFFGLEVQPNPIQTALHQVGVAAPRDLSALMRGPVAVLLASQTGSAGERVALAFRQRIQTRSFGSRTAGVATARRFDLLPDGAAVAITSSLMDTTRTRDNSQSVTPDVIIADETGQGDRALAAASAWVTSNGCGAITRH